MCVQATGSADWPGNFRPSWEYATPTQLTTAKLQREEIKIAHLMESDINYRFITKNDVEGSDVSLFSSACLPLIIGRGIRTVLDIQPAVSPPARLITCISLLSGKVLASYI